MSSWIEKLTITTKHLSLARVLKPSEQLQAELLSAIITMVIATSQCYLFLLKATKHTLIYNMNIYRNGAMSWNPTYNESITSPTCSNSIPLQPTRSKFYGFFSVFFGGSRLRHHVHHNKDWMKFWGQGYLEDHPRMK